MYLWDLIGIKLTKFSVPDYQPDLAVDRISGRSTGPVDRVHENVHMASLLGRSTARSTDWKHPTLGCWPVDQAVDRRHNGQKYDRCANDRVISL